MSALRISACATSVLVAGIAWFGINWRTPAARLSLANTDVTRGGIAIVPVVLTSAGGNVTGLQFDLTYDPHALTVIVSGSVGLPASEKTLDVAERKPGVNRILIEGLNRNAIPNGSILQLRIVARPDVPMQGHKIRLTNAAAVGADGVSIALSAGDAIVTVTQSGAAIVFAHA